VIHYKKKKENKMLLQSWTGVAPAFISNAAVSTFKFS
jgi:hypothetical protein